ncbi:MAG: hypothetical protein BGO77_06900 [Caedibacter sp. 37-49]|nr:MAG: hypothetical protein BGO77_06900 [Caedibacter sp. 37-49]
MNAFGESALYAAIIITFAGSIAPFLLIKSQPNFAFQFSRLCAVSNFLLITISFLSLIYAFLNSDFSLQIVASHSHSKTPSLYKITGVWGNHEGSMVLWVWILSLYTLLIAFLSTSQETNFIKTRLKILSVQFFLILGFLTYSVFLADPFMQTINKVLEGQDLNPILQDPALAIHPPLLYLGYVGFSLAYSFSVVGLFENTINSSWASMLRKWVLVSWIFLTLGIATGSFWAYYELGWGGYWFWDPVENAALMPWLLGTALIHSLLGLEKEGLFKLWSPLLGIASFMLCLIGTYIVRSGVISSVHSFATDPTRGAFILGFTGIALALGAGLLIYRAPKLSSSYSIELFSREGGIIVNNFLLTLMCFIILLGTLSPLLSEFWLTQKLMIEPGYFQYTVIPLALVMLVFMVGEPVLTWRKTSRKKLSRWINYLMLGAIGIISLCGINSIQASFGVIGLVLAGLILISLFIDARLPRKSFRNYAILFSHAGVAIAIMGMSLLNLGSSKTTILLKQGERALYKDYTLLLKELKTFNMPTYEARQAYLEVKKGHATAEIMIPEKRFYQASQTLTTEIALKHTWLTDLYIVLGGVLPTGEWVFEVALYPGIQLLWLGSLLMVLGGIIRLILNKKFLSPGKN